MPSSRTELPLLANAKRFAYVSNGQRAGTMLVISSSDVQAISFTSMLRCL
jgi:hypothetical protein